MKIDSKVLIRNVMAGVTVSFIALSLGAAFGILSGRGAFAGMLSSALIAFIASAFGGTRIQCSGPTGPMTAVTAVIVATAYDSITTTIPGISPDHFVNITILLGGVFMIAFGILRLGKYIQYIPNVVISGFMNGIAIIIVLDQIKRLVGIGGKEAIQGSLIENSILVLASLIGVFVFQIALRKYLPKLASIFSGTLVTLIVMTALAYVLFPGVERVELASSLRSIDDAIKLVALQFPTTWSWEVIRAALPFALQLAVLGYLDTLMTSLVIDKMTKETTRPNKELIAQGLANSAVSFVGGIPGAQATIRSVLMVKEKATLRLAGMLVGIFALIEMIVFQDLVNLIPQAVFAGILLKVAYDVFDWLPVRLYFKELAKGPGELFKNFLSRHDDEKIFVTNREMIVIVGTALVTVFFDLNIAVGMFTVLFYLHNKIFFTHNPMRDLKPGIETKTFNDEA